MIIQILVNSCIYGLILALVALGFHVIFSATKIFHLAHRAIYVAGVFFFYWISPLAGILASVIISLIFAFALDLYIEWSFYKQLFIKINGDF